MSDTPTLDLGNRTHLDSQISSARRRMDSLAQELIDEIINRIPLQDMPASSLVARRWRCRSQQRHFEFVLLTSYDLDLWEFNVSRHSDSIPSYVRHVRLKDTARVFEPVILPRVLKAFTSITSLAIENTTLHDKLAVPGPLDEFGKSITQLALVRVSQSFAMGTSLVFSLPNLKELVVDGVLLWPNRPPPITIPDTSQRGPLELFVARGPQDIYFALSQWKLASRRLSLNSSLEGVDLLVKISSETVVELTLMGMQLLRTFGK